MQGFLTQNMALRKKEIKLQDELETQEEWEEYLAKEGLLGNKQNVC